MIELLTVLVIIAVLTTISAVTYNRAREKARLARVKTNVGEMHLMLAEFARDHSGHYPALTLYHHELPPSGGYTTTPNPPSSYPDGTVPAVIKRMGNAIIGGGPALVDTGKPLQDDFWRDELPDTVSFFRLLQNQLSGIADGRLVPIDALGKNSLFEAYPVNPLKGPGEPMVNVAHMLYDYDTQTNAYQWVTFNVAAGPETRTGLCAARPAPGGVYEPIWPIWDEVSYPQGDFAYIPLEFTSEQGTYCSGYWIIDYGDLTTLANSPYNKYSLDPNTPYPFTPMDPAYANWPNLPPPFGDGSPNTPPAPGTVEFEIKRMVLGALEIRATVYEDQLSQSIL